MISKTPKFWENKYHLLTFALYPFSIIYYIFFKLNSFLQKQNRRKLKLKAICIGNIYLGGTGKTPLAHKIFQDLKNNRKCCVLKKFNKNQDDEIKMLRQKTTLFTPKTRLSGLLHAEKNGFDTVILDDGMQDYSFNKYKSILCIKSDVGFGNEFMIPAGPLREPLSSIKNYNIALINGNKCELIEKKLRKIHKDIIIFYSKYTIQNKAKFLNKKFLAFSGISNNDSFFRLLKFNNLDIKLTKSFEDHHSFTNHEIEYLLNICNQQKLNIITTEKNYHGIPRQYKDKISYIKLKLEINNFEKFLNEIN